jgi:8-oxo-dGTP diphosphatase
MKDENPVVVVAAVIERQGRFLLTRRLEGTHLAGTWEFPGGKCGPGETHEDCLAREMREELAVEVRPGERVLRTVFAYPDRTVELNFYRCALVGEPVPQLGQDVLWAGREYLPDLEFPPADQELVELLTQPLSRSGKAAESARDN